MTGRTILKNLYYKCRPTGGFFSGVLFALTLFSTVPVTLAHSSQDSITEAGRLAIIDFMLNDAISKGLISGATVAVGDHSGLLYQHSTGTVGFTHSTGRIKPATIFDVASLTKVFATTPAIVRLMDEGALSLLDPLSKWYPEFSGSDITLLNLLTHTSGLSDVSLDPSWPIRSALSKAAAQKGRVKPGTSFLYADINFIILGDLVKKLSGKPLDRYVKDSFYLPLGMKHTGFTPPASLESAHTIGRGRTVHSGVVQDENAKKLGGVAGHAGLFSTVSDLALFSSMILNNGEFKGKRLLSSRAVQQMTAPYYFSDGKIVRGLGWDRISKYSSPKGTLFSEFSFGHTGYSGSSIWIDPDADLYVILLTTRLEYKNIRKFNRLRSDISTLAAAIFAARNMRNHAELSQNAEP